MKHQTGELWCTIQRADCILCHSSACLKKHLPGREVAVHSSGELGLGSIPLLSRLEGNVGGSVVDDGEG